MRGHIMGISVEYLSGLMCWMCRIILGQKYDAISMMNWISAIDIVVSVPNGGCTLMSGDILLRLQEGGLSRGRLFYKWEYVFTGKVRRSYEQPLKNINNIER